MDDARFDALAKRLAGGVTRRSLLRGIASLTGAGVVALRSRSTVAAADCTSRCARLPAGDAREQCQAACAAADQAQATADATRAWAAALRACQGDETRLCGSGTDVTCCGPAETCKDGECVPGPCGANGDTCTTAGDCCSGVCTNDVCAACPPGYRECDGGCYPGGCCSDADCGGLCQVCGTDHVCDPCEAVGQICQNGTCVPFTTTTTTSTTTSTTTTSTTTAPPTTTTSTTSTTTTTPAPVTCPAGTTRCPGRGDRPPSCCGGGSFCLDCPDPEACGCCPTNGGPCLTCPPEQTACCPSDPTGHNTCTCCASGQTCCDGACADLQTDPQNCGGCGQVCGATETCQDGQCLLACPAGSSLCHSGDRRPTCCDAGSPCLNCTDFGGCVCCTANGGACINCPPGQYGCCTTEAATPNDNACTCCAGGQTCCNGTCTDLHDAKNCGVCGNACGVNETCVSGACQCPGSEPCPAGATCCASGGECACATQGPFLDPTTCSQVLSCPAGSTPCVATTNTCGVGTPFAGPSQVCCPGGTACDPATGTCRQ